MAKRRILVFGASITLGCWDTDGGWVDKLKRVGMQRTIEAEGQNKIQVINLGVGGDTSTEILARMPNEIDAREKLAWETEIVVSIGTNDVRIMDEIIRTPKEQFAKNILNLIEIAKKHTEKITFVGIPPIGKKEMIFSKALYSDELIEKYDGIIQKITAEQGVKYINTRNAFAGHDDCWCYDFLHPNDKGHHLIFDAVKDAIL